MVIVEALRPELTVAPMHECGRSAPRFVVEVDRESFVVATSVARLALALRGRDRTFEELLHECAGIVDEGELRRILDAIPPSWRNPDLASVASPFYWSQTLVPGSVVGFVARYLSFAFSMPFAVAGVLGCGVAVWFLLTSSASAASGNVVAGVLLSYGGFIAHEFGHAAALARFGRRPAAIGVGIYLLFPVLYSEVNAAWTLTRRRRVCVDLGGMWLQSVFLAALVLFDAAFHSVPGLRIAAAITLVSIMINLNPLIKFDGYWALGDALGIANLHAVAKQLFHVRFRFDQTGLSGLNGRARAILTTYALAAAVYFAVLVVLLLQWMFFALPPIVVSVPPEAARLATVLARSGAVAVIALLGHDIWTHKQAVFLTCVIAYVAARQVRKRLGAKR